MRRKFPVLRVLLVLGIVGGVYWWGRPRTSRTSAAAADSSAAAEQRSSVGQGSGVVRAGAPVEPATPAPGASGLVSESPALAVALAPFVYAHDWSADLRAEFAAFRSWSLRYAGESTFSARAALESEGLVLARARRVAMKQLIERDPRAALAATVPAAIRAQLPSLVVSELETRFSAVGDYTVLAFDYGPLELIRRKQAGLPTDHFQSTVQWPGSSEYRAYVYGRREGLTTKHAIPLHGIVLDGVAALHESAVRVLEPGEISSDELTAEIGGQRITFPSAEALLAVARKYAAAESGLGPRSIPALGSDPAVVPSSVPASGSGNSALPATAWTVGAKKILHLRVDFSDLPGEPKRGSTVYTAAYVKDLADAQVNPYYAASSYGQVSLTNTVSTAVYRLPQTASYYATGSRNTQLHTDARTLAAADYTLSGFDRIVVIFSSLSGLTGSQITYGGLANVGGPYVWVNGEYDFRVAAHELGHTWGLRHANLWLVTDGNAVSAAGTSSEYGDDFDTMGANFANSLNTDFNPWFKNLLGWIADSQVQTVATNGTFRVNRFDAATATGTLALKVVRDATRNYWIGTRRSFTANTSMSQGAYVIWGYNTNTTSNLLDLTTPGPNAESVADAALAPNATLLDTIGNVSLKTIATGGTAPAQYLDVEINVGLNGYPVITSSPVSQGYAVGSTVSLSVTATGTAPLAYQWTKSGLDLPGANSATYTIPNAQPYHAGSYAVRVTNAVGSATSAAATLAVNAPPVIDRPPGHVIALAGRAATFTVAASGLPAPTYQWRKGAAPISGATGATLTLTNVQTANAGDYDVVVTNSAGSVTSAVATLTVNAAPTNDAFANALPLVGLSGTAHSSNVDATGETGEPQHNAGQAGATASSVWFRWTPTVSGLAQIDTLGTVLDTGLAVYTGSALTGLTKLKEDDDGGAPSGGGPSLLTLNVTAGTTYSIAVGSFDADPRGFILLNYAVTPPPAITAQPVAPVVALGGAASFTVTATGWNLAYQWYRNGVALTGATAATLALGNLTAADVGTYLVVVSNSSGSISSSSVILSGGAAAASITAQPGNVTVTAGQTATLSVAATVPAGATPAYQWRRNGLPVAGATQSTYSISGVTRLDADFYDVVVYSDLTPVVSQTARLAVAPTAYPAFVAPDPAWELRPESSDSAFGWAVAPISDGRAYIAGFFSTLGTARRTGIARLAADGTVDATFLPPEIDGLIRVLAVQSDGNIVIAGDFTRVGLYPRNRVARLLSDGTVDATFNPGSAANAAVSALAVQPDGKILLGGSFTAFAGTNRDRVVRLNADGSVDNGFSTRSFNNGVNAFAVLSDGNILVGGDFTSHTDTAGVATTRNRLVRLTSTGALSGTFTPAFSGNVTALAVQTDAKILVGGFFSNVSGTTVGNIARLNSDGTVDTAFTTATGAGFDSSLKGFVLQSDGKILVAGLQSTFAGVTSRHLTRLLETGARDTTYLTSGFNNTVGCAGMLSTGKLLVGGAFSQHTSSTSVVSNRARFARLNADGSLDTAVNFAVRCPASINALVPLPGGKTFVSGFFTHLRGTAVPVAAARLNADGTVDTTFNAGGTGANSNIYAAVAQPDGRVVITGFFTSYNGTTANRLARLNVDGTLDSTFAVGAGLGSSGFTLTLLPGGRIFVGGGFTTVAGTAQNRVAVYLPDGGIDPAFVAGTGANSTVYTSALQADGKIVIGGSFSTYNGTTATRLARLNLDGTLDTTFVTTTGANSDVYALAAQPDGKWVVGGFFNAYASVARGGLARVTSTGALDTSFVPPTLGPVYGLLLQENSRIVARGSFPSAGGESGTGFLTRFLADGTRDPSFAAAGFAQSNSAPASFIMRDQGQLLMQSTGAAGTTATQSAALPIITKDPVAQSAFAGSNLGLSVTAVSAFPLTYQWRRDDVAVPNGSSSNLALTNLQAATAGTYTVVVSNELGATTSAPAVIRLDVPVAITTQPSPAQINLGANATFSVVAVGNPAPSYRWRRQAVGAADFVDVTDDATYAGSATATLSITAPTLAMRGDKFYCVVANSVSPAATSITVSLIVNQPPQITSANAATFMATVPGSFTLTATGTPTPGFSVVAGTFPSWATFNVTTGLISGTPPSTVGSPFVFTASASNSVPPNATQSFTLTVVPFSSPPAITTPPVGQAVPAGATIALSVVANGTPAPTYQWRRNTVDIPGATNVTFTRTNAQLADAGSYTVFVANSAGNVTSAPVTVSVIPPGTSAQHAVVRAGYTAGGTVTITNTLTYVGAATGASWQVLLPAGWTFASSSGVAAATSPVPGAANLAEWTWSTPPASPLTFSYALNVPAGTTNDASLVASASVVQSGATIPLIAQPDPLVVASITKRHSADSNGDGQIDLFELTRVIELYNRSLGTLRTGAYKLDATSEDGFAPDASRSGSAVLARYHSADTNANAQLGLLELTRVIELYNTRVGTTRTGSYHVATVPTEDGFAPGP